MDVIGYEARCLQCGETFNPHDEHDLEHVARLDGAECGGAGEMVGAWGTSGSPRHCGEPIR